MRDDLPSFDPQHPEARADIPERFLVPGLLALRADGVFLYAGDPVTHPGLAAHLHRQLRRTLDGDYWVVNGPQRSPVDIMDTPFFVRRVVAAPDGLWLERLDGGTEPLGPEGLRLRADGSLTAVVRRGEAGAAAGDGHPARLLRTAQADLAAWLQDTDGAYALQVGSRRYPVTAI
jgi:hypothetical protein